jgi:hypothetical protein
MGKGKKVITRRDFLRTGSYLTLGSLVGLPISGSFASENSRKSTVVLIRDENVISEQGRINRAILGKMLDEAVSTLMGTPNPSSAWGQLLKPEDIVGIKSNVWGYLPTPEPLEAALRVRLMDAGVNASNISIDDRGALRNKVFRRSTGLINVRPMRTHHWSGLGTLLKNYIMFVPEPSKYHGNACEKLGAIWKLPHVAGKTRLNILVMLTPLFHGIGPHHFSRRYVWPYRGLIVSRDPVAADATGARIIQAKRDAFFGTEKPISPVPRHIAAADEQFGLGNSRPERIELLRPGWQKDALI